MNSSQKEKLVAIVKNDCQKSGRYFSGPEGSETCILGAMIMATNSELKTLTMLYNGSSITYPGLTKVLTHLMNEFGLDGQQLCHIQRINDLNDTPEMRRERILEYVERITNESTQTT